jgi:hypothetical protein
MNTTLPDTGPDTGAESEALIQEARRRQRRRYLLTGLVVVILAGAAGAAVSQTGPGDQPPVHPGPGGPGVLSGSSAPSAGRAAAPRFFADAVTTGEGNGPLEVRSSATGGLVAGDAAHMPVNVTGLAATGPDSWLIAEPGGGWCDTRLYRVQLAGRGRLGGLTPVGPELPGSVWSLAASAGGQMIGYAVRGCGKGSPGYVGVFNARTGRSREWDDVSVSGISPGHVVLSGALSMSANGSLLAFTGWDVAGTSPMAERGRLTSQVVRVLLTNAPVGSVARRSRVVLRRPVLAPQLAAVSLSPTGSSFYLCTPVNGRGGRVTEIARYATSSGSARQVVATLGGTLAAGCSMALDTTGRFLLVPYAVGAGARPLLKVARIDAAARVVTIVNIRLPVNGGMDPYTGMTAAW